jgi:chromosome partitioning protein
MVLAIVNLKGGTGKTTTAVNLAACMALEGRRVLLVDMDPLGDATIYTGREPESFDRNLSHVLFHGGELRDVIVPTGTPNLDLAPSGPDMANADLILGPVRGREMLLARGLAGVRADYDFVVIDTPPGMNLLQVNSLTASESIIVPTVPTFLSIRGLKELTRVLAVVKTAMQIDVSVLGILLTLVDSRTRAIQDVIDRLREKFGMKVFDTVIRRSVGLIECPSFGQTIFEYDGESLGARCYRDLAVELRMRLDESLPVSGNG